MGWIETHHLGLGILSDTLTVLGGCLLTRDAFLRLRELNKSRIDVRFRNEFPRLNLTDQEWKAAVASVRWALSGFALVVAGFLLELLLRLMAAG